MLRKYLKEGNISKADFSGKYFDKEAIEPNKRRSKHNSIKPEDIIRKSVSPSNKKLKAKSFYHDRKEEDSFIERSVKIPKKPTRSKSKNKNNKSRTKDKSILRDHFNEIDRHRNSQTKVQKSISKVISRSSSKQKRRKEMKDLSLAEDMYRPRVKAVSTTKNRKSHQGSYIIGA